MEFVELVKFVKLMELKGRTILSGDRSFMEIPSGQVAMYCTGQVGRVKI